MTHSQDLLAVVPESLETFTPDFPPTTPDFPLALKIY